MINIICWQIIYAYSESHYVKLMSNIWVCITRINCNLQQHIQSL